jgi:hypothetical protein
MKMPIFSEHYSFTHAPKLFTNLRGQRPYQPVRMLSLAVVAKSSRSLEIAACDRPRGNMEVLR